MIRNRLEKNWKKLNPWAQQLKLDAVRIYDHDIPEFPFFIDKYLQYLVIYDKTDTRDIGKNQLEQVIAALQSIFGCSADEIIVKKRERQKGENQYTKLSETERFFWVQETQAKLQVNLWDYLDTGLFLDHRPMRQKIFKSAANKSLLNLFCYTGSISVFAALGGARTTSVDMSATYVDWTKRNFVGNQLDLVPHRFLQENALEYLEQEPQELFDMIFLDPPTFSNSKRMSGTFDVERDQEFLVNSCMKRLKPDGVLYFSNNKNKFKLFESIKSQNKVLDITASTIPKDFHDQKVHVCFEIKHS